MRSIGISLRFIEMDGKAGINELSSYIFKKSGGDDRKNSCFFYLKDASLLNAVQVWVL